MLIYYENIKQPMLLSCLINLCIFSYNGLPAVVYLHHVLTHPPKMGFVFIHLNSPINCMGNIANCCMVKAYAKALPFTHVFYSILQATGAAHLGIIKKSAAA